MDNPYRSPVADDDMLVSRRQYETERAVGRLRSARRRWGCVGVAVGLLFGYAIGGYAVVFALIWMTQ